jgi:hypothetical protein
MKRNNNISFEAAKVNTDLHFEQKLSFLNEFLLKASLKSMALPKDPANPYGKKV